MINQQDDIQKRISDNCFKILSDEAESYHMECQSRPDGSMMNRMFEYGAQIALDNGELQCNILNVKFPKAAVLFLRHTKFTPDVMHACIETEEGEIIYPVKIVKIQNYTVEEIFRKMLLLFIPFHIFVYENQFMVYNESGEQLEILKSIYRDIWGRLDNLCRERKISAYTRSTLNDMSRMVLNRIAKDYENIRKALGEIMGGRVLEYETKTIFNAGKSEGALNAYISLLKDGLITLAEAAKRLKMSEEEVRQHM